MGLDIRWPIGLMFSLIGALLTAFGLVKKTESISVQTQTSAPTGLV